MKIARATVLDLNDLIALHKANFDVAWDRATFQDFLDNDLIWVATRATQNKPSGFIIVRHTLDEAEVITLMVASVAQRNGMGSALLANALDHVRTCKVNEVFLEVARDNLEAIALYTRAGFGQIGMRRAYYSRKIGPDVDALVLSWHPDYTQIVANN